MRFGAASPYNAYGLIPSVPRSAQSDTHPGIAVASGPGVADNVKRWSPDHPLFWFAAFGAVTFGLIAASTQVRVGPLSASVSAGRKKAA